MKIFYLADAAKSIPRTILFAALAAVPLMGCAGLEIGESERVPTGMHRTTETKDSSGRVTKTDEPITVERQDPPFSSSTWESHSSSRESDSTSQVSDAGSSDFSYEPGDTTGGFSVGVISTQLWHDYTSSFLSSSFSGFDWSSHPKISGTGAEGHYYLGDEGMQFSVGLGGFTHAQRTNSVAQGSLYAVETIETTAYWGDIGIRFKPLSFLYLEGLGGLFFYDINTRIETNAPTYTYEGFTGFRTFPAIGIGGGFETPGDFPLHLYAGTKFWLPIGDDTFYEHAIGQINGGLLLRF